MQVSHGFAFETLLTSDAYCDKIQNIESYITHLLVIKNNNRTIIEKRQNSESYFDSSFRILSLSEFLVTR